MGLDQTWITIEKDSTEEQVLYTHRKLHALEDFMASTWYAQPENFGKVFNSERLDITLEILDELRKHIARNLFNLADTPLNRGFFAERHLSPEDEAEILEAVEEAETAIEDRDATVYYTSSW